MKKECKHPETTKGVSLNGNKLAYFYDYCKSCGEKWINHELTEKALPLGDILRRKK